MTKTKEELANRYVHSDEYQNDYNKEDMYLCHLEGQEAGFNRAIELLREAGGFYRSGADYADWLVEKGEK